MTQYNMKMDNKTYTVDELERLKHIYEDDGAKMEHGHDEGFFDQFETGEWVAFTIGLFLILLIIVGVCYYCVYRESRIYALDKQNAVLQMRERSRDLPPEPYYAR